MADAVKVIDGAIAKFEEQDNPRPVMAVKGELGFIDNLEKIIEERDEDIDIGQLGRSNYDALMLAALDAFRASLPTPVVPEPKSYMDFWEQYPDMTAQEAIDRSAGWNACRSAMLQAGNSPSKCSLRDGIEAIRNSGIPVDVDKIQSECEAGNSPATPDGWIPVSERMPGSQEWVIVFAKWANQQVLCWDDVQSRWTDFEDQSYYADMFSHWMPLPAAPQEVKSE